MTASSPILHCYRELELLAEHMLELARAGNWTAMAELQQVYTVQVDQLRRMDHSKPISDRERMDRYQRLERILGYDAAIRNLLAPEMNRLGALLGNARRQQDLHHAYGSVAA